MSLPHRHVFFPDDAVAEAEAAWTCACGLVASREGNPDGSFVVIGRPEPSDPLAAGGDALLARALEGLESIEESLAGRRTA